ncbi:TPA: hypothetical protein DIV49_02035 [Candidatus Saccharibacteria bacterium]|nr:hypothetical protein [Candidatus Saccharibacteria bacterium]HRF28062.1 hypothetical protein [Candidatus Saccharibacteria bacterium]HRJ91214.1 hypothetical protein [Candidatus Saccharibacteria bacterium]
MTTIEPANQQQSISDDQELAKVLAGVNQEAETTPAPAPLVPTVSADDQAAPVADTAATEAPASLPTPDPIVAAPDVAATMPAASSELDGIKQEALSELRPLVDKLNVSAEEKFDTYLLLLRSTDDRALIAPAHDAAKGITDEARRAQALLDIIKEIDFLSQGQS